MPRARITATAGGRMEPAVPPIEESGMPARTPISRPITIDPTPSAKSPAPASPPPRLRQAVDRPSGRSDRDVRNGEVPEQQRRDDDGHQECGLVGLADAAARALEDEEPQAEAEDRPQQGPDELNDLGHGPMIPLMNRCRGPDESMKEGGRRMKLPTPATHRAATLAREPAAA